MLSVRAARVRPLHAATYATVEARRGLNTLARAKAEELSKNWKGTNALGENTKNFIGGEFVESSATKFIDVVDPVRTWQSIRSFRSNILYRLRRRC
jgi:malonate-semialdehyde dehydrogenase (acetylating)/methylmalonate-semialdehyde dehydrogenase